MSLPIRPRRQDKPDHRTLPGVPRRVQHSYLLVRSCNTPAGRTPSSLLWLVAWEVGQAAADQSETSQRLAGPCLALLNIPISGGGRAFTRLTLLGKWVQQIGATAPQPPQAGTMPPLLIFASTVPPFLLCSPLLSAMSAPHSPPTSPYLFYQSYGFLCTWSLRKNFLVTLRKKGCFETQFMIHCPLKRQRIKKPLNLVPLSCLPCSLQSQIKSFFSSFHPHFQHWFSHTTSQLWCKCNPSPNLAQTILTAPTFSLGNHLVFLWLSPCRAWSGWFIFDECSCHDFVFNSEATLHPTSPRPHQVLGLFTHSTSRRRQSKFITPPAYQPFVHRPVLSKPRLGMSIVN